MRANTSFQAVFLTERATLPDSNAMPARFKSLTLTPALARDRNSKEQEQEYEQEKEKGRAFVLHCARVDHYSPCALCDLVLGNALQWSVWRRFCSFAPARSITSARYQKCKRNITILPVMRRKVSPALQKHRLHPRNLISQKLWPNTNT